MKPADMRQMEFTLNFDRPVEEMTLIMEVLNSDFSQSISSGTRPSTKDFVILLSLFRGVEAVAIRSTSWGNSTSLGGRFAYIPVEGPGWWHAPAVQGEKNFDRMEARVLAWGREVHEISPFSVFGDALVTFPEFLHMEGNRWQKRGMKILAPIGSSGLKTERDSK